ncbi:MAG: dihydrofolate reductase [bacterium]
MIKLIWAMDKDNLVGKDNLLAWHYKEDLLFFKKMTKDKEVLMGDNTYDSLQGYYKGKPLPFGETHVATLKRMFIPNVDMVNNLIPFISNFPKDKELFVIGGKTIYDLTMPYADILYVTVIDASHEGNVYFYPDLSDFELIESNKSGILDFRTYQRVKK